MTDTTNAGSQYPAEIQQFHDALARVPGVSEISSGIESLQDIGAQDMSLASYGHLPLGALRRTNGGLPGEALVQVEFYLTPDTVGWRGLEFLAWWARDAARGGESIQLRPYALPPRVGETVQLGHTLRFHIDIFLPDATSELAPILAKIAHLAGFLNLSLKLYAAELNTGS